MCVIFNVSQLIKNINMLHFQKLHLCFKGKKKNTFSSESK